jgi:predicted RNase H-like nuclease
MFAAAPEIQLLAIDIPIGLTDADSRTCDVEARSRIKPRASCVFNAPIRPALDAATHPAASEASFRVQRKKVSIQSWAIYPKIRELDALLRTRSDLRECIFEVHPEVSFREWRGAPVVESKKTAAGRDVRLEMVRQHFGAAAFESIRARYLKKQAQDDDILDAFAALWTAERIRRGEAYSLPENPPLDSEGLPMRMMV